MHTRILLRAAALPIQMAITKALQIQVALMVDNGTHVIITRRETGRGEEKNRRMVAERDGWPTWDDHEMPAHLSSIDHKRIEGM